MTAAGYCRQHDPDLARARKAARPPTKWEREFAAQQKRDAEHSALRVLLTDVADCSVVGAQGTSVVLVHVPVDLWRRVRALAGKEPAS